MITSDHEPSTPAQTAKGSQNEREKWDQDENLRKMTIE